MLRLLRLLLGGEDYLQINGLGWNDMPETSAFTEGYFVEYPVAGSAPTK